MTIEIKGLVVDRSTGRPVDAASVEALINIRDDAAMLAKATLEPGGLFTVDLEERQWKQSLLKDPDAFVFFRVFVEGTREPAADTQDSLRWKLDDSSRDIRIEVDVPAEAVLDPVLSTPPRSEYEEYLARLQPLLKTRSLYDLNELDTGDLSRQAEIPTDRLALLVSAARLARDTKLDPAFFYALLRQDVAHSLEEIFSHPEDLIRKVLDKAYDGGVVPRLEPKTVDAAIQQLKRLRSQRAPLVDLAPNIGLDPSLPVFGELAGRNIKTLVDVRKAGGVARLAQPDPALHILDAHAQLGLLPSDLAVNAMLIERGYTSLTDIAAVPRDTFVASLGSSTELKQAEALHAAATAQTRFLANTITSLRVNSNDRVQANFSAVIGEVIPPTCGCENCNSATGPMAYLADLLDYALRHLKHNGVAATLTFLQDRFHQPFRDLPVTCELLEKKIRQVRICIEVLRKHLPGPLSTSTSQWYLETAYNTLLEKIGTSFEEIRQMRSVRDPKAREAFAARLGIKLHTQRVLPNNPDELDRLFLDTDPKSSGFAVWPRKLSEEQLEQLFGLRDTKRPPLDPDVISEVLMLRMDYLRSSWHEEDRSATPPLGECPIIDPDIVGYADLKDATPDSTPRSSRNKNSWTPLDFLQDRRQWTATTITDLDQFRKNSGLTQLLDELQRPSVFGQGRTGMEGLTVPFLQTLRGRNQHGEDIAPDLQSLNLEEDAFDYLSHVSELSLNGEPILDSEWRDFYSIIVARLKIYSQYDIWRNEEARNPQLPRSGITLSPDYFRPRQAAFVGGSLEWVPERWRAHTTVRHKWESILRSRIEQEQAVIAGLREAVDATEEVVLVPLRDELRIAAGTVGNVHLRKPNQLTGYLQIDVQGGGCQITTRVAQAIETVQGLLFGARNGLLEDDSLTLDADNFDEEWQWIGSYSTWRAAMQVFLYPENALRPTLRRRKTPAFEKLIKNLRSVGRQISQENVKAEVARYEKYFADVCSLQPVALHQSEILFPVAPNAMGPQRQFNRRVLALGQAAVSGKFYFSKYEELLGQSFQGSSPFVQGVRNETFWSEVEGLPSESEVVGLVPYQHEHGEQRLAIYALRRSPSGNKFYFTSFDYSTWQLPRDLSELPALVCSNEILNSVTTTQSLDSESAEWSIGGEDRLVAVDIDGNGRKEILVLAKGPDSGGRVPFAILREEDGGLVVSWNDRLPQGWDLPSGGPVILVRQIDRVERLLVVNKSAQMLGLLSEQGEGLGLVSTSTTGWTVNPAASFVAADLDGNGISSLVAIEHTATGDAQDPVSTNVTVLSVSDSGFALKSTQEMVAPTHAYLSRPSGGRQSPMGYHIKWEQFVKVALPTPGNLPREALLAVSHRTEVGTAVIYVALFHYTNELTYNESGVQHLYKHFIVGANPAEPAWVWNAKDHFVVAREKGFGGSPSLSAPKDEIIVLSPSGATGVLRRQPNGQFAVVWQAEKEIASAGQEANSPTWQRAADDKVFALDLQGERTHELVIVSPDAKRIAVLDLQPDGSLNTLWADSLVRMPGGGSTGWFLNVDTRYFSADIDGDGKDEVVVLAGKAGESGRLGILRGISNDLFPPGAARPQRFGPVGVSLLKISPGGREFGADAELVGRRNQIENAYIRNVFQADGFGNLARDSQGNLIHVTKNEIYLDEAFYFVPMELGLRLRESGNYTAALDWFRSVYEYDQPLNKKIAYKLVLDAGEPVFERGLDWLRDPLSPHAIAETRKNSYTKFTILAIVRCLLDFADAEFTRATSESIPRARELYLTALGLLDSPELKQHVLECSDLIGQLVIQVGGDEEVWVWNEIRETLWQIKSVDKLAAVAKQLHPLLLSGDDLPTRLREAQKIVADAVTGERPTQTPTFSTLADEHAKALRAASVALLADNTISEAVEQVGLSVQKFSSGQNGIRRVELDSRHGAAAAATASHEREFRESGKRLGKFHYLPAPSMSFCIPPSQVIQSARSHAELSLYKLRACRNIAGMELRLEPYAAPTAAEASLQTLGSDDQLPSLPSFNFQPLPYRYSILIERTKQLVELARQMESSMLSFLVSADQEKYQEIKARQDLALTQAGVRLKDLQLNQAEDGITGALQQRDRAQLQADTYKGLIDAGLNTWETLALVAQHAAVTHLHTAAAITEASTWGIGGIGEVGGALAASSQVFQMHASFERRAQEWKIQVDQAKQDVRIGQQQIRLAQDQVRVAAQERTISALQVDQAEQILDYLTTQKFTGYDLYEWMSGVIEQVYRFFLQQATSMAQAAEGQLAFERQEIPSTFIQTDYWEPPSQGQSPDFIPPSVSGQATSLRGLTGSARLLRDVYELDQYAFLKNQRKLQLTETISLAQLDPFAFEQFRATGVLLFATPMSLFDRKFPGHYLRLVKRVRTTVVGLIPPTLGIRATLSTTGTSRAVIGNDTFDTVMIQRGPEAVALSSPVNATGLFELDPQPELLVPFEGIGVDTNWEFRLPKPANLFDYRTLADVLITIEYTALDSFDYRQQVLQQLDRAVSVDRAFSLRQQFPDAWYDLNNPDQATPPAMTVHFKTTRDDFPPNLDDQTLNIQQLVLYVARTDGKPFSVPLTTLLEFSDEKDGSPVGGTVTSTDLIRSTRRGNALEWQSRMLGKYPAGEWTLTLPSDLPTRSYFEKEEIEDILFVITYAGQLPEWPL